MMGKMGKKLSIQMPNSPQTVGELRQIRVWLHTLSRTHFSRFINPFFFDFNPASLGLLFFPPPSNPNNSSNTIKFRADHFEYPCASVETLLELAPYIWARTTVHYRAPADGIPTADQLVELACSGGSVPASFRIDYFDELQPIVQVHIFV
jgi:hypothetical protein